MRGSAIIAAMILIAIGVIVVGGYFVYVSKEINMAKRMDSSVKALFVGEAGLERGLADLSSDPNWFDGDINGYTTGTIPVGTYVVIQYNGTNPVSFGGGTYYVQVSRDVINTQKVNIISIGVVNGITRKVAISVVRQSVFDYGIMTEGPINLSNNVLVDSYNSANGLYGGTNIHTNGNIRTNAGDGAGGIVAISLSNNSSVKGNTTIGPNGIVSVDITQANNSTITGIKSVAPSAVVFPSIIQPSGLPSRLAINLSNNQTATISQDGNYPSIQMANNCVLTVAGNVTVYVAGAFSMSNNSRVDVANGASINLYLNGGQFTISNNTQMNNISKNPSKMRIYCTNSVTSIVYSNNAAFYGTIYAPKAVISQANNVNYYGALVGKTLNMSNNFKIHFDEALMGSGPSIGGMTEDDWHEVYG